ncbi:excinuclease ABC subunit UvrC [Prosthecochloris sp. HL-130-GSB]|jgi:excinuclease ABC subunit C|uniref:excinuclease ABC subunit UvrC n=1 Tax=Prosthecochloris sp. HL-130-GSB TaxID=1974213 RepID=UPI000A1C002B|nr:excinuclease ABC subunit UvrC [Prosthecochloris sp. HL-130-GSB]ARM30553.1 excinuclease ABC subunit C [Prosthecochloris sp. HL-130-GSB]
MTDLEKKLASLPTSPGVYQFKNGNGNVIYVGKAKNIRSRVRSYFRSGQQHSGKTKVLLNHIRDLDVIITSSEVEALILENNLIKDLRPRYNINLKDDKTYPYVVITNEPFPRVLLTRQVRRDGATYFGPYTEARQLRSVLDLIGTIFPVRDCKLRLTPENIAAGKFSVCLNYHIHKCKGPCEGLQSEESYLQMIEEIKKLLKGRTTSLIKSLEEEMHEHAKNLRFEQAGELKLQIEGLKKYAERQKVVTTESIDRDVFAVARHQDDACGIIFKIREGKLLGSQRMYFSNVTDEEDTTLLTRFLEKYYLETPDIIPDEIFLPSDIGDEEKKAIQTLTNSRRLRFSVPRIGEKAKLVQMCTENARHHLAEYLVQKQKRGERSRTSPALEALQKTLRLDRLPQRIECFDNSHFQGTDYTSSMVCFVNAKPRKSDYRKFRLHSFEGSDDYAAMKEAVTRRYSGSLSEELPMPDLIVIDGGKGQVNIAWKTLRDLGIDTPVIGLAKRLEEVFLPNTPDPYNLPRTSPALKLLQNLRDEAHRFAITYHRNLRTKRTLQTELTTIEGIGEKSAMKLLEHFGSVRQIASATEEELRKASGPKTAAAIYRHFHGKE